MTNTRKLRGWLSAALVLFGAGEALAQDKRLEGAAKSAAA